MKLLYNFLKDMKLSAKSFYFYVEIGFALVILLVLLFVVPENFDQTQSFVVYLNVDSSMKEKFETSFEKGEDAITYVDSRKQLETALQDNRSSVGLVIAMKDNRIVYEYVLQGYEDEKMVRILETSVKASMISNVPGYKSETSVTTLDAGAEKLSDRLNMVPVVLTLNAAFMGLFIIASYIFLDKQEGTIKALAVTPSPIWQYLVGKIGVVMISGMISGIIILAPLALGKAHYFHYALLLFATNLFGSTLGLFIASFFDTMGKAMGWLYMSIIVLGFASVSYYMPAFSPLIIRLLPSYPMLFAFREILLDSPDLGYIYMNVGGFTLASIIIFLLANRRFNKTLTI